MLRGSSRHLTGSNHHLMGSEMQQLRRSSRCLKGNEILLLIGSTHICQDLILTSSKASASVSDVQTDILISLQKLLPLTNATNTRCCRVEADVSEIKGIMKLLALSQKLNLHLLLQVILLHLLLLAILLQLLLQEILLHHPHLHQRPHLIRALLHQNLPTIIRQSLLRNNQLHLMQRTLTLSMQCSLRDLPQSVQSDSDDEEVHVMDLSCIESMVPSIHGEGNDAKEDFCADLLSAKRPAEIATHLAAPPPKKLKPTIDIGALATKWGIPQDSIKASLEENNQAVHNKRIARRDAKLTKKREVDLGFV